MCVCVCVCVCVLGRMYLFQGGFQVRLTIDDHLFDLSKRVSVGILHDPQSSNERTDKNCYLFTH